MKTRTVGIVGAGRIADEHLAALRRRHDVDVVGVCDLDRRLAARAARLHGPRPYLEFGAMLEAEHPDIVHVTTPAHTHVGLAREAIAAGCKVIVLEKPAALSAHELADLLAFARDSDAIVTEDHNYRFNRPVQHLAQYLAAGAIGSLRRVDVRMAMPLSTTRYEQRADRQLAERMPGGVLREFLPHLCYLTSWLLPTSCLTYARWDKHDESTSVTPDSLFATVECVDGAVGTLAFESAVAPFTTTVTVHGATGWAVADLQLASVRVSRARGLGDDLNPLADMVIGGVRMIGDAGRAFVAKLQGSPIYQGIGAFLDETYECLASDRALPVSPVDMLAAAALADTILEARA